MATCSNPADLFAREVIIPGLNGRNDVRIVAELPEYFQKTMDDCDLLLNRHDVEDESYRRKYYGPQEMQVSKFQTKGISPYHVNKESSL